MKSLAVTHAARQPVAVSSSKPRRQVPYKGLPLWWKLLNFACRNVDAD
jgi:hypothetical protein